MAAVSPSLRGALCLLAGPIQRNVFFSTLTNLFLYLYCATSRMMSLAHLEGVSNLCGLRERPFPKELAQFGIARGVPKLETRLPKVTQRRENTHLLLVCFVPGVALSRLVCVTLSGLHKLFSLPPFS